MTYRLKRMKPKLAIPKWMHHYGKVRRYIEAFDSMNCLKSAPIEFGPVKQKTLRAK